MFPNDFNEKNSFEFQSTPNLNSEENSKEQFGGKRTSQRKRVRFSRFSSTNGETHKYVPIKNNTNRAYNNDSDNNFSRSNYSSRLFNEGGLRDYNRFSREYSRESNDSDRVAREYDRENQEYERTPRNYERDNYSGYHRSPYYHEERGNYERNSYSYDESPRNYNMRNYQNDQLQQDNYSERKFNRRKPYYAYKRQRPYRNFERIDDTPRTDVIKSTMPFPRKEKHKEPIVVVRYKNEGSADELIRLNRFLANSGLCSRRDADEYITQGLVKVNGEVVTELGTKVCRNDEITYCDELVQLEDKIYVLLNKPIGFVTTSEDPEERKTVMDLVKSACPERIYPVGRLDRNTTGVLLLTNDGEMAARLTHPQYMKKKIYHVYLNEEATPEQLESIRNGIVLDDGPIHADAIEFVKDDDFTQIGIEIHSGRNRIVRRIFEHFGYHVKKLDRVYFAGLTKKNLRRGRWRYLTTDEVNMLKMGAFE